MASLQPVGTAPTTAPANTQLQATQRLPSQPASTLTRASEDKSDCFMVTAFKWVISLFKNIFCCSSSEVDGCKLPVEPEEFDSVKKALGMLAANTESEELDWYPVDEGFIENLKNRILYSWEKEELYKNICWEAEILQTALQKITNSYNCTVQFHVMKSREPETFVLKIEGDRKEEAYGYLSSEVDQSLLGEGPGFYVPSGEPCEKFEGCAQYECHHSVYASPTSNLFGERAFEYVVSGLSERLTECPSQQEFVKPLERALQKVAEMKDCKVSFEQEWSERKIRFTFEGLGEGLGEAYSFFNQIDQESNLKNLYTFTAAKIDEVEGNILEVCIVDQREDPLSDFLGNWLLGDDSSEDSSEEEEDWG